MCKLLADWLPSAAAIDLIKLNGINEAQIAATLQYLKNESQLNHIDDIEGYDSWNAFFIMFCLKANK